jgi:hypothetical protein
VLAGTDQKDSQEAEEKLLEVQGEACSKTV